MTEQSDASNDPTPDKAPSNTKYQYQTLEEYLRKQRKKYFVAAVLPLLIFTTGANIVYGAISNDAHNKETILRNMVPTDVPDNPDSTYRNQELIIGSTGDPNTIAVVEEAQEQRKLARELWMGGYIAGGSSYLVITSLGSRYSILRKAYKKGKL
jgi:hypothetical protein